MGWPTWTRRHIPEQRHAPEQESISEGEKAHHAAAAHLAAARAKDPEVKRVSRSLASLRQRNHFGELVEELFHGGRA